MATIESLKEARQIKQELRNLEECLRTIRGNLGDGKWVFADRNAQKAQTILYEFLSDLSKQHPHEL